MWEMVSGYFRQKYFFALRYEHFVGKLNISVSLSLHKLLLGQLYLL